MYKTILAVALLAPSLSLAQGCFGPGGCEQQEAERAATGPTDLCLPEGCNPVTYTRQNGFAIAESRLPNGWPVLGWSGPCIEGVCPDLLNQAFSDLNLNALRANRAQRF